MLQELQKTEDCPVTKERALEESVSEEEYSEGQKAGTGQK